MDLTVGSGSVFEEFDWVAILDRIDKLLPGFDLRSIYCMNETSQEFQMCASRGFPNTGFASRLGFKNSEQIQPLFEAGDVLLLPNVSFFKDHPFDRQAFHLFRFASGGNLPASSVFFPIQIPEGHLKTLVILDRFRQGTINQEKAQALYQELVSSISQLLENSNSGQLSPEEPLKALYSVVSTENLNPDPSEVIENAFNQLAYLVAFDQAHIWQDTQSSPLNIAQAGVSLNQIHFSRSIRSFIERGEMVEENDPRLPKELILAAESSASRLFAPLQLNPETTLIICLVRNNPPPFSEQDQLQTRLFLRYFHAALPSDLAPSPANAQEEYSDQSKQKARQTAIIEAMFDGVLVTDSVNKIQYLNSALYQLTSLDNKPEQHTIESFSSQFGDNLDQWKDHILTWSLTGKFEDPKPIFSDHIELKNGRVLSIHLSPIILGEEFLGTVSIFRDVTYEFAFDRLKTDFITSISHELRTPLTSISGYIDLLLMGVAGSLNESQESYMRTIKENSFRLNNLINDLLELTTIESGNFQMRVQAFDLISVARETARKIEIKNENKAKKVRVTFDHPSDLPLVLANPDRSRQIIENLINNACAYSAEDGFVNVSITQTEGFLQVSVHNQHVFVPPEHNTVIFDKFYKGDDPSIQILQGSGLGLPIIKQLVELQQGKIWVSNDHDLPGSTFTFTLPIWDGTESDG